MQRPDQFVQGRDRGVAIWDVSVSFFLFSFGQCDERSSSLGGASHLRLQRSAGGEADRFPV